jgi:hypothetical protein
MDKKKLAKEKKVMVNDIHARCTPINYQHGRSSQQVEAVCTKK